MLSDAALIAQSMRILPSTEFSYQADRGLDLLGIRVTLFDKAHWQSVGAEDEMNFFGLREAFESFVDAFDEGGDVERVIVKIVDHFYGGRLRGGRSQNFIGPIKALPFFQATSRCRERIMRVEREENQFVESETLKFGDCFGGERMPVAHRDDDGSIEIGRERRGQGAGLAICEFDDGRAAANGLIMFADDLGTLSRDESCERFAGESGAHEVDDFGIAEKVIEERLDRGERVRAAQLEEYDADFFARWHSQKQSGVESPHSTKAKAHRLKPVPQSLPASRCRGTPEAHRVRRASAAKAVP